MSEIGLIHNHMLGADANSTVKQSTDYIGFSYNGVHSSDLGIVRVSDGSRFNENLLPTIQDKTVQVPGGDGTYYFGSYYTQRQFSVSFAFDSLTEVQLARLKSHFGDKRIHDLIFDEVPYKVYKAKVTGTATIKYIPFAEGTTNRIYKGEGSIQFTCYYPFAQCRFKTRKEYEDLGCTSIDEWWSASNIDQGGNFGDIDTPFTLEISGEGNIVTNNGEINWNLPQGLTAFLNTKIGLALDEDGNICNEYLTGNTTMKIPVGAKVGQDGNDIILVNGKELDFICYYI